MNILKGVGIVCGATVILAMGLMSASFIILVNEEYKARRGDVEYVKLVEKQNNYYDGIIEANTVKEAIKLTKEYLKTF